MRFLPCSLLVAACSIVGCGSTEEPKDSSEEEMVASHRGFFGLGPEWRYYLYSYSEPGSTDKRCWYYAEVAASDPAYADKSAAAFNFAAMSAARPLVEYPLEDSHVRNNLLAWGAAESALYALNVAGANAACGDFVALALSSAVVPVLVVPSAGAAVLCGLTIVGMLEVPDVVGKTQATMSLGGSTDLAQSATSETSYHEIVELRDAVTAEHDEQLTGEKPCTPASALMKKYEATFVPK